MERRKNARKQINQQITLVKRFNKNSTFETFFFQKEDVKCIVITLRKNNSNLHQPNYYTAYLNALVADV